ncbi:MAG: DUF2970 domain-containing protein [Burkholderiaceae bacterium]|nr:DUF2970 domain-containing protein [Sulfuritalea sp.]MCF8175767.1 DUF2970 domain-containing protein [Burkholderiaceae bacterium]MCF8183594.1 DUF2970 domain-containing protein [Polynucleobacter sp.]
MQKPESGQKSTIIRTIRMVAWGLLGVRGHKLNEKDLPALSPLHILITALIFMLVFVLTLVAVAINLGRP